MILDSIQSNQRIRLVTFSSLFILVVVGFWLRIRNLGSLGLIADEGIQALAVKGILKYGIPKLESGFVYLRSLPYAYVQATAVKIFDLNPFWLRFPSVIFSVAVIVPTYLLGKNLFNRPVGLLSAAIMTFSMWEIELARYARFYSIFQLAFTVSLLCFYKGFMLDDDRYKVAFILAGLFALSVHKLGQVLLVVFIIPLLSDSFKIRRKVVFGFWALCLVGIYKIYGYLLALFKPQGGYDFISGETGVPWKTELPGFLERLRTTIGIPAISLPDIKFMYQALEQNQGLFIILCIIAFSTSVFLVLRYYEKRAFLQVLFSIAMIWMAFFYKFGLVTALFGLYAVIYYHNIRTLWQPRLKLVYGVVFVCFLYWFNFLHVVSGLPFKQTIDELFFYPNVYNYFIKWFINGWPLMTIVVTLGCIALFVQYFSDRYNPAPLFCLGAIFFPVFMTSFFSAYVESRYAFHLYPLIVIVFSLVMTSTGAYILKKLPLREKRIRSLFMVFGIVAILFISQDANPINAWSIGNRSYQSAKDPFRSVLSWEFYADYHQDFKGPSLFVKKKKSNGDKIIALGPSHMLALYQYYVGNIDFNAVSSQYVGILKNGKAVSNITNSEYIIGEASLKELIKSSTGGLWLLGDLKLLENKNPFYDKRMKEYLRTLCQSCDFYGADEQTFAVRVK